MEHLTDLTLKEFAAALADKAPVPGGGGAAALAGALAASLGSMAARYTSGKKYADVEEQAQKLAVQAGGLSYAILNLVEKDAAAFEPLSKAWAVPKDDPGRTDAIEAATVLAVKPPLELLFSCGMLADTLSELEPICNPMLLSDVGCAAALCGAVMRCAALNVYVNTRTLTKNREGAEGLNRDAEELLEKHLPELERITAAVTERMRG